MKLKVYLFAIMVLSAAFGAKSVTFEVDGIYYNILDESAKTVEVTKKPSKYSGTVNIPENVSYDGANFSVTAIGEYAFSVCPNLGTVTIPNSVTSIKKYAFGDCHRLTSVTIPASVITIGEGAFGSCKSLTSLEIPGSVTTIGDRAFSLCEGLTSVSIPNSVTSIGDGAFANCLNLTSVTIGNSVTFIGDMAFKACISLTSVTIPASVNSIGIAPFELCGSLAYIEVDENNAHFCSIDGVLFNKEISEIIMVPGGRQGEYVIPDSVTSIWSFAFEGCIGLTSVTIPGSVTSIGDFAFNHCVGLTSVTIPDQITSIGEFVFNCCTGLTSVTIPGSVTSIGEYAFASCSGLTSVTIPGSVITIGNGAFEYCESLTSVTSLNTTPPNCGIHVFYNISQECVLHVLPESLDAYKTADVWRDFFSVIGDAISSIGSVEMDTTEIVTDRYDLFGHPVGTDYRGLVIEVFSNGRKLKRLVK